jgi:hypothetical protein
MVLTIHLRQCPSFMNTGTVVLISRGIPSGEARVVNKLIQIKKKTVVLQGSVERHCFTVLLFTLTL